MMGMFDYIRCDMPLPETPMPAPHGLFQTKDTPDQYLSEYRICKDGRLWREVDEGGEVSPPFHGDVDFYTIGDKGQWWEYRARFTEGVCSKIILVEFRSPNASHDAAANCGGQHG